MSRCPQASRSAQLLLLSLAVVAALAVAGCRKARIDPVTEPEAPTDKAAAAPADFTVAQLTAALADDDPDVRSFAAARLGAHGAKAAAAVEPLAKLLADPRESIRAAAAGALGRIGKEAAP